MIFHLFFSHEGRKMKQELRCHAVLCPSESKARAMAQRLQDRLRQALVDFRREKISRQNARLSLANSVYENPSMPYRKILLHTGTSNYRPPHERGKSAPKLKAIEEESSSVMEEEEEEEDEEEELAQTVVRAVMESSPSVLRRSLSLDDSGPPTEVTSLASEDVCGVGVLLDLGEEEEEEEEGNRGAVAALGQTPSFVPGGRRNGGSGGVRFSKEVNDRLVASFDDEEEEEEEDEVIDYLPSAEQALLSEEADGGRAGGGVLVASSTVARPVVANTAIQRLKSEEEEEDTEVDSAAPVSPDSNRFSTRSSSVRSKDGQQSATTATAGAATTAAAAAAPAPAPAPALGPRQGTGDSAHDADSIEGEEEEEEERRSDSAGRLSEEQDTISDESGYSEESNPSRKTSQVRKK